ncbi:hypothetical protein A359_06750 [secondary endosymbiont of Ctenarytaina eucalypti]|uniref:Uncharacterized protein n=1 Tax=secondary endosymbiont of Ctenarytaina eucalypti TaxID=1199245 RepID=J3TXS3_9ENTR|nr:hypothetical protein A359_06750 [secondary endosymbiont of Ctenarytaina eucalypti]
MPAIKTPLLKHADFLHHLQNNNTLLSSTLCFQRKPIVFRRIFFLASVKRRFSVWSSDCMHVKKLLHLLNSRSITASISTARVVLPVLAIAGIMTVVQIS